MERGVTLLAGVEGHFHGGRQGIGLAEPLLHLLFQGSAILHLHAERDGRQRLRGIGGTGVDGQAGVDRTGVEHRGDQVAEQIGDHAIRGIVVGRFERLVEGGPHGGLPRCGHGGRIVAPHGRSFAVGGGRGADGRDGLVGVVGVAPAGVAPAGSLHGDGREHGRQVEQHLVSKLVDGEPEYDGLHILQLFEPGLELLGVHRLPLGRGVPGRLVEQRFEPVPHLGGHPAGEELDGQRILFGERLDHGERIVDADGITRLREDRPAVLLDDFERRGPRGGDPPDAIDLFHWADHALHGSQQLFEILDGQERMRRRQWTAGRRDHHADWPLDVEPGQPLALRGQQDERLREAGQRGVAHLLADPRELLAEIGVAVGSNDRDHFGLVGRMSDRAKGDQAGGDQAGGDDAPAGTGAETGSHGRPRSGPKRGHDSEQRPPKFIRTG